MKRAGFDVEFTYVVNDMDPMDSLPTYLDQDEYVKHMGKPFFMIPSPDRISENYAVQYANEYIHAFNKIGFRPQIFWSSELYKSGKMDQWIKLALDNVEEIRKIYKEVADQDKPNGWYPFQVICPSCGKVGTSLVTGWDGKEVRFECKKDLVRWAEGCGHKGVISPFKGSGKLMWKVDWPAHWAQLNITVEGAGKDHFSAGGSRFVGAEIIKRVFQREAPFGFLHEFLLISGAKMSSSKGVGMSSADLVSILPPEVGKFLFVRTPYQRAINFDPTVSATIPDLFDEYDRATIAWFKTKSETDLGRMFEAAQINIVPTDSFFIPRFRQVAMFIQMPSVDLYDYFAKEKGSELTPKDREILDERIHHAHIWLEKFAEEKDKFHVHRIIPPKTSELDADQKKFLNSLADLLTSTEFTDGNLLQQYIYNLTKNMGIDAKKAFQGLYICLINKDHGPKAGWLLLDEIIKDKEFILQRLHEASNKM
jgi:lysyl-tRNA synthetase class 1